MSKESAKYNSLIYNVIRPTTPQGHLVRSFAALIALGTAVLACPFCQATPVPLIDCFFTAVSAVCVTGLTTVEFASRFSLAGQIVTIVLTQLGGVGIITFAALAFRIVGSQISLASQAVVADSVLQKDAAGVIHEIFGKIVMLLLGVEVLGALLMTCDRHLWHGETWGNAAWQGIFHAISAFCNAGFALWPDSFKNQDTFFAAVIMLLIFTGGIGQAALVDIFGFFRHLFARSASPSRFSVSYNTKVVLWVSLAVIVFGIGALLVTTHITARDVSFFQSVFYAVSSRTAGFSCFELDCLTRTDKLVTIFLMFVGGSPGSCAGGIKTTSLAIWIASVIATLRNREEYTFLGRQIPKLIVNRARKLIQFTLLWNIFGIFLLCLTEKEPDILTIIFEQVSAFGTVGLSLGMTPDLSEIGKLWICLCMFIGRMGPLTIALGIAPLRPAKIAHPEGQIMIG